MKREGHQPNKAELERSKPWEPVVGCVPSLPTKRERAVANLPWIDGGKQYVVEREDGVTYDDIWPTALCATSQRTPRFCNVRY